MTLHVVLPTADGHQLAWISDTTAFFGLGNTSRVNKVTYLSQAELACSFWGESTAAQIASEFADRAAHGKINISSPDAVISSLRTIGKETLELLPQDSRDRLAGQQLGHGVIVATFNGTVRLYQAHVGRFVNAQLISGEIIAGDVYNPARIFPMHYYPISGRSLCENLFIGIHTMRLARIANSQVIGDANAWAYDGTEFRQLKAAEISQYVRASESLDAAILKRFCQANAGCQ